MRQYAIYLVLCLSLLCLPGCGNETAAADSSVNTIPPLETKPDSAYVDAVELEIQDPELEASVASMTTAASSSGSWISSSTAST